MSIIPLMHKTMRNLFKGNALRSRNKEADFEDEYPKLYQYLASTFPLEEFDYASLEDAMLGFVTSAHQSILDEGLRALNAQPFPLNGLSHATLYNFRDEDDAKSWLQKVLDLMQSEINKDLDDDALRPD